MYVVGLTGGIGSGKSEAARLFAALGASVIDTDLIAHQLTGPGQPVLQAIRDQLGAEFLLPDGTLDRAGLRRRVFEDASARQALQALLHPLILQAVKAALQAVPESAYVILVVPLLFESGSYRGLIDRSLLIDCDEAQQIERAMSRSALTEAEVRAIMAVQCSRAERLAQADDVIVNDQTLEALADAVSRQNQKYIKTCMLRQSIS